MEDDLILIDYIYINNKDQKKGFGKKLLREAIEMIKSIYDNDIILQPVHDWQREWYMRKGFIEWYNEELDKDYLLYVGVDI